MRPVLPLAKAMSRSAKRLGIWVGDGVMAPFSYAFCLGSSGFAGRCRINASLAPHKLVDPCGGRHRRLLHASHRIVRIQLGTVRCVLCAAYVVQQGPAVERAALLDDDREQVRAMLPGEQRWQRLIARGNGRRRRFSSWLGLIHTQPDVTTFGEHAAREVGREVGRWELIVAISRVRPRLDRRQRLRPHSCIHRKQPVAHWWANTQLMPWSWASCRVLATYPGPEETRRHLRAQTFQLSARGGTGLIANAAWNASWRRLRQCARMPRLLGYLHGNDRGFRD